MVDKEIAALVAYAERTGLIEPCERAWAVNTLLEGLGLDSYTAPEEPVSGDIDLAKTLEALMDDAHARGCSRRTRWYTGTSSTPCSWAG